MKAEVEEMCFEDEEEPQLGECGQSLGAGKGKEKDPFLQKTEQPSSL